MEDAQSDAQSADVFSLESHEELMVDNVEENYNPEAEESGRFQSDSYRASTVTHIEIDELSEAASHWDDRTLPDGAEEPFTREAQSPRANDERRELERELELTLDHMSREAGKRAAQGDSWADNTLTTESTPKTAPSGPDEQASRGREIGPNAPTNAADIAQASKERGKSVAERDSQDVVMEEPLRWASDGESRIASQATGQERVRHAGIGTSADAATRISQLDERPMEYGGEMAKASEDVEEAGDEQVDDILQADAEQRTIGNWELGQQVALERAATLAQLEAADSPANREVGSINKHRPVTEFHLSDIVMLSAGQTTATISEAPVSPEHNIDPQPLEEVANERPPVHSQQAGAAKQRQRPQAKPSKIQKISTAKLTGRDANHTTMRVEAIDIELEEALESPRSERMSVDEGATRGRQVRFDISHEAAGFADTLEGEDLVGQRSPRTSPPAVPSGVSTSGGQTGDVATESQLSMAPSNSPPPVPSESATPLLPERANLARAGGALPGHSGKRLKASTARAEKVVTRLDFADWDGDLAEASDDRTPPGTTATTQGESERRSRKKLTPRIVERPAQDVRPRRAGASDLPVTVVFRIRDESGNWRTAHEVVIEGPDPSEVERVARKEARNRQATFYDKNGRKLTPAQCFEAAIEDGSNMLFMQLGGDLAMDEDTMRSIAREAEL
jgi:hypothetical protein